MFLFHFFHTCWCLQQNESSFVLVRLFIARISDATKRRSCFHKRCYQTSSIITSDSRWRNNSKCENQCVTVWFLSSNYFFSLLKVQEGIELAAYENIPGNQKVNLLEILGAEVPSEVIANLQGQIDGVGRS